MRMDNPNESLAVTGLAAEAHASARVLILGSLPGRASLAQRQYYAHPRNQFWRLMSAVLDMDLTAQDYATRLRMLGAAGVALWDVVGAATRPGSLDSAIRAPEINPLLDHVRQMPQLAAIGFNGQTAYKLGAASLQTATLPLLLLPSSSPAYAAMSFEAKAARWRVLREALVQAGTHS